MNKGELQAEIERVRSYKKENLEKLDEARSRREKRHYQRLIRKNESMIQRYESEME